MGGTGGRTHGTGIALRTSLGSASGTSDLTVAHWVSSEGKDELPSEWPEAAGGGLLEVRDDDDDGDGCDTVEADGFDAGAEFEEKDSDEGGGRAEPESIYPAGMSKAQRWLRSKRAQAAGSSV